MTTPPTGDAPEQAAVLRDGAAHVGLTARAEWRRHYMLPVAAAMGYATSVIHIYGIGAYIEPISQEFGWSRTRIMVGLTIATAIQALFGIPIGILVDRIGPRLLALIGVVTTCAAFALLGTATGTSANWYLLWFVMALAALPVQATIWTSAVSTRFEASRGLAFAITLCGASVAAALFPALATWLTAAFGWRTAIAAQAGMWLIIAFPVILLHFRSAKDVRNPKRSDAPPARLELPGLDFLTGLRSPVYRQMFFASTLFPFAIMALVIHFVPILSERGIDRMQAAGVAALIGIFSIVGRLGTGILLDRYRGSLVGAIAFALPVIGVLVLLLSDGHIVGQILAASLIGLALGAEVDVIVYLTTRHFGLKNFGGLYGGLLAALSVGTALGPLGAGMLFDAFQSYSSFMWLAMVLMLASSLALLRLPPPRFDQTGSTRPAPGLN